MAGYALARSSFPGKRALLVVIVITLFLPRGYTIVPVYDLITRLHLLNTLWSVVVVQVAGGMVFNTFLFMGYFITIARELDEAAQVDGAGFNTIYWYVLLPAALALGQPERRTPPVGLYAFVSQTSTNWTALCAGLIITLAPIVLVFVFAQR